MDIILSNNQIKQLSLSVSINDVLDCIKKDYDGYLKFLDEELKKNKMTKKEYQDELILIEKLKNEEE